MPSTNGEQHSGVLDDVAKADQNRYRQVVADKTGALLTLPDQVPVTTPGGGGSGVHVVTSTADLTNIGVEWLVDSTGALVSIYINGVEQ